MKRLYTKCLLLFALSVCSVIANAQTLSVESIEANTGEQAELVVSASGMSGVTALQFNLALPQSVTLNVSAITKGSAVSSHELKVEKKANGEYLFVLYHLDLGLVSNGTLVKLPITTGQQSGSLGGNLNTIRTASADAVSHNCADASFNITVKAPVVPVTITANNLTMVYGDDVPTLTYTSEGGALNGTPKLSTTATKTSPVGTYPIKVEKGTITNEAVTYVAGTLTITQAPLTVGVQNVTIKEGDAIPSFTLTYSGFRNGDTESKAFTTKPTATTTATSSSKAGTYPITVSGGSATNYALTYTQGTLTITEKTVEPATVTANNLTMVYGDDVPTLTYTSEGGALNGTPKLSTTATKASPVGTYPIKVEKGTVTNEAVTYVDGTLTITQAPLTVGVQNVTITEGDAIPSFTLTYSGFRNGDTEANAFTTKPTATTTATSSSKAGTYPITVSGGSATNYALTYTHGTLTIMEKESTTTWTNIVVNSDLEGNDVSCFYKRENYSESETVVSATIGSNSGKDSSRGIAVKSVDNPSGNWNTQFFVRLPQTIPAGTKYRLSFDYKASREAYVLMEIHAEPSEYIFYDFDHMTFTPSWQHYESEGTITEEMSTDENKMRTLAFDLAHEKTATTYYFDNIFFEIEQAQVEQAVTIIADNKLMTYGDDVPTLTYKSSGAKLNGTPKLSTTATKTSPVGTYPIKVEKGTVTNEAVTYVEGTLTITQAPLTVGVQNVTITEGDAIPSFTLTYSSYRNGDTEANAFTTKPTATTTATSSSKAGTYPITVSGGTATNYSLTYTQGTLTIKEKDVILGDLNDDGSVSITDVVLIIDVIAGSITDAKKVKAADVNKDGSVTITDCVAAIDLIAAQTKGARMNRASQKLVSSDYISAFMKDNLLTVNFDNENHYTAFQMVVTMPEGMTLDKAVIDKLRGTDHQLTVRNLGNGQYLVAGFSMGNSELAGNSGRLLTIGTKGQTKGDIIISDIEFATAEAEAYRLVPITISNAATGIYQIENREWKRDDAIFDLQGRRVNQPTHGLYIKNGKLIIVKQKK